jgi:hypothetical protein
LNGGKRRKLLDLNKIISAAQVNNLPRHKAHNLPGSGRGGSKHFEQSKNKQHLYQLAQQYIGKNKVPTNILEYAPAT